MARTTGRGRETAALREKKGRIPQQGMRPSFRRVARYKDHLPEASAGPGPRALTDRHYPMRTGSCPSVTRSQGALSRTMPSSRQFHVDPSLILYRHRRGRNTPVCPARIMPEPARFDVFPYAAYKPSASLPHPFPSHCSHPEPPQASRPCSRSIFMNGSGCCLNFHIRNISVSV